MGHQGDRQGRSRGVEETQGGVSQPKQIAIEASKFLFTNKTLHKQGNTFTPPCSTGSNHRQLLHPMILSILIVCSTLPYPFLSVCWVS